MTPKVIELNTTFGLDLTSEQCFYGKSIRLNGADLAGLEQHESILHSQIASNDSNLAAVDTVEDWDSSGDEAIYCHENHQEST